MAQLIAIGNTETSSAEFTLTAGDVVTLFLTSNAPPDVPSDCVAYIAIKSAANQFFNVATISGNDSIKTIASPGIYRVTRIAGVSSFGVDKV